MQGVGRPASDSKIKHVVIIVQENRSFNNLFYGFPGATTATYGYDTNDKKVALKPIPLQAPFDLAHNSIGFLHACNGVGSVPGTDCRMNGFNKEQIICQSGKPCPKVDPQYAYVPHDQTKPYFDMAKQYVLADQMYASNFDASSFVSHQYIIAGQANSTINYPDTYWGCPGGPTDKIWRVSQFRGTEPQIQVCFNSTTLGDELDGAKLPWAFYAIQVGGSPDSVRHAYSQTDGIWSAYQAIKHIYKGPDWSEDVISPPKQFLTDVSNGNLRTVSWITPTCANSDHAGCDSDTGPSWVTSLVNAVGQSQYWNSTAIFIFWDDYGGWYDPEPPAYVDYDGLGLRLPMLIISPYAKKGYISHVHYEHGSILKFIEDRFGLPRLSASDTRANSPMDAFDFSQSPRKFVPIQAPHDENYFKHQPIDNRPPDTD
jgi:phospholipase C